MQNSFLPQRGSIAFMKIFFYNILPDSQDLLDTTMPLMNPLGGR
jgi:hypothetical protein